MCKQLIVIKEETAEKFQESFNSKLRELQDQNPTFEFNHKEGYCAYIIYSDNDTIIGSVEAPKPRYLCDTCMKCLEKPHPRVKWRKCAHYGGVHGKTECKRYLEAIGS